LCADFSLSRNAPGRRSARQPRARLPAPISIPISPKPCGPRLSLVADPIDDRAPRIELPLALIAALDDAA
jgi:hypothetical protein